ncbi:MAG: thioesterase family protein [Lentisphaeria bacterium]|nr:thioesterase family protein [Lentisphaeria bacterium]
MFTTSITPRFGDTDMLGHINNVALPRWFEAAREPVFRFFVPEPAKATKATWPLILVHMDVDFHAEMNYGLDVDIRTTITRMGDTSLTLRHEAWQAGICKASGGVVLVCFDFTTGKKQSIPAAIRERLQPHLVS